MQLLPSTGWSLINHHIHLPSHAPAYAWQSKPAGLNHNWSIITFDAVTKCAKLALFYWFYFNLLHTWTYAICLNRLYRGLPQIKLAVYHPSSESMYLILSHICSVYWSTVASCAMPIYASADYLVHYDMSTVYQYCFVQTEIVILSVHLEQSYWVPVHKIPVG